MEEAYGNYAEVELLKNKATLPDRRVSKYSISYDCGIDGYNDTFEMAVVYGIIDKAGAWYAILDADGNIVSEEDGTLLKFQGKANAMAYLKSHESTYLNILDRVNKEVCKD